MSDSRFNVSGIRRARWKSALIAVGDAAAWFVSVLLASFLRYEFDAWRIEWLPTLVLAAVMAAFFVIVGLVLGIYLGKYAYGSLDEVRAVTLAAQRLQVVENAGRYRVIGAFIAGRALSLPR